ncbi:CarD family transcriptional regulator [Pyruvatibacter sp.]|uniref:CarD family transcriptional regulator n=1 Tax=Pyruvatibacter sp. TaxID=1981328 RepID=UPI0032ED0550
MPAKKKAASKKLEFKANDFIVYPAHGVGKITGVEKQEVAGHKLELFVINFEKEKMTLRVPVEKVKSVGMRRLAADDVVGQAIKTLKGRARVKRTMWSRRAQEYEAKINSGDLIAIAEVVRDLYRSDKQPEQSYSERQLYEQALERMAREVAAVEKGTDDEAVTKIESVLEKAPSRNKPEKEEGAADAGDAKGSEKAA